MPPKDELLRPFENVISLWHRRKRVTLEWQTIGNYGLFARPFGAEHEFLWAFSMITSPYRGKPEYMDEYLSQCYHYSSYSRRVLFSYDRAADEVWLFPRSSSCGLLRQNSNNGVNWKVRFNWEGDYTSFQSAPTEFFVQNARRAIEERPESWQRTLEWTHLGWDARFWSCVSWKNGNKEEWQALMTALFQLVLSRLPPGASHHWPPFRLIKPRFAFTPLRMSRGPHQKDFPDAVWPLLALSDEYFGAIVDYSQKIASQEGPFSALSMPRNIKALHPSHHELMVALDLWREFGHKSGQSQQVEAGLQQLLN